MSLLHAVQDAVDPVKGRDLASKDLLKSQFGHSTSSAQCPAFSVRKATGFIRLTELGRGSYAVTFVSPHTDLQSVLSAFPSLPGLCLGRSSILSDLFHILEWSCPQMLRV